MQVFRSRYLPLLAIVLLVSVPVAVYAITVSGGATGSAGAGATAGGTVNLSSDSKIDNTSTAGDKSSSKTSDRDSGYTSSQFNNNSSGYTTSNSKTDNTSTAGDKDTSKGTNTNSLSGSTDGSGSTDSSKLDNTSLSEEKSEGSTSNWFSNFLAEQSSKLVGNYFDVEEKNIFVSVIGNTVKNAMNGTLLSNLLLSPTSFSTIDVPFTGGTVIPTELFSNTSKLISQPSNLVGGNAFSKNVRTVVTAPSYTGFFTTRPVAGSVTDDLNPSAFIIGGSAQQRAAAFAESATEYSCLFGGMTDCDGIAHLLTAQVAFENSKFDATCNSDYGAACGVGQYTPTTWSTQFNRAMQAAEDLVLSGTPSEQQAATALLEHVAALQKQSANLRADPQTVAAVMAYHKSDLYDEFKEVAKDTGVSINAVAQMEHFGTGYYTALKNNPNGEGTVAAGSTFVIQNDIVCNGSCTPLAVAKYLEYRYENPINGQIDPLAVADTLQGTIDSFGKTGRSVFTGDDIQVAARVVADTVSSGNLMGFTVPTGFGFNEALQAIESILPGGATPQQGGNTTAPTPEQTALKFGFTLLQTATQAIDAAASGGDANAVVQQGIQRGFGTALGDILGGVQKGAIIDAVNPTADPNTSDASQANSQPPVAQGFNLFGIVSNGLSTISKGVSGAAGTVGGLLGGSGNTGAPATQGVAETPKDTSSTNFINPIGDLNRYVGGLIDTGKKYAQFATEIGLDAEEVKQIPQKVKAAGLTLSEARQMTIPELKEKGVDLGINEDVLLAKLGAQAGVAALEAQLQNQGVTYKKEGGELILILPVGNTPAETAVLKVATDLGLNMKDANQRAAALWIADTFSGPAAIASMKQNTALKGAPGLQEADTAAEVLKAVGNFILGKTGNDVEYLSETLYHLSTGAPKTKDTAGGFAIADSIGRSLKMSLPQIAQEVQATVERVDARTTKQSFDDLSTEQQAKKLGFSSPEAYEKWRSGDIGALSIDQQLAKLRSDGTLPNSLPNLAAEEVEETEVSADHGLLNQIRLADLELAELAGGITFSPENPAGTIRSIGALLSGDLAGKLQSNPLNKLVLADTEALRAPVLFELAADWTTIVTKNALRLPGVTSEVAAWIGGTTLELQSGIVTEVKDGKTYYEVHTIGGRKVISYDIDSARRDEPNAREYIQDIFTIIQQVNPDLKAKIFSGGQDHDCIGKNTADCYGSIRHNVDDDGYSRTADIHFELNGQLIDPGNPAHKEITVAIIKAARAAGLDELGIALGGDERGMFHIGTGNDNGKIWGYPGGSINTLKSSFLGREYIQAYNDPGQGEYRIEVADVGDAGGVQPVSGGTGGQQQIGGENSDGLATGGSGDTQQQVQGTQPGTGGQPNGFSGLGGSLADGNGGQNPLNQILCTIGGLGGLVGSGTGNNMFSSLLGGIFGGIMNGIAGGACQNNTGAPIGTGGLMPFAQSSNNGFGNTNNTGISPSTVNQFGTVFSDVVGRIFSNTGNTSGTTRAPVPPLIAQQPDLSCSSRTAKRNQDQNITVAWTCYNSTSADGIGFPLQGAATRAQAIVATGATSSAWITYGIRCSNGTSRSCLIEVVD